MEALSQHCIRESNPYQFIDYLALFERCEPMFSKSCSTQITAKLGMNREQIGECVNSTFVGDSDDIYQSDNNVLKKQLAKALLLNSNSYPALFINDILYRGSPVFKDVYLTICALVSEDIEACRNVEIEETADFTLGQVIMWSSGVFAVGLLLLCLICRSVAKQRYLKLLNKAVEKYIVEYERATDVTRAEREKLEASLEEKTPQSDARTEIESEGLDESQMTAVSQ